MNKISNIGILRKTRFELEGRKLVAGLFTMVAFGFAALFAFMTYLFGTAGAIAEIINFLKWITMISTAVGIISGLTTILISKLYTRAVNMEEEARSEKPLFEEVDEKELAKTKVKAEKLKKEINMNKAIENMNLYELSVVAKLASLESQIADAEPTAEQKLFREERIKELMYEN